MRPIEFRGFSISDKQWKYGYYYVNTLGMHNIVCLDGHTWEVDPESVGQYTWRKDKNGVKIYGGDVVADQQFKDRKWVITWTTDSEYCWFVPREVGKDSLSYFVSWGNMTIIGNTYEHPNLLQL